MRAAFLLFVLAIAPDVFAATKPHDDATIYVKTTRHGNRHTEFFYSISMHAEHSLQIAGFQISLDLRCAAQWHLKKSNLISKRKWTINSGSGKQGGPMLVMGFTQRKQYLKSPLDHYPLFSLLVHDDDVEEGATLADLAPYIRLDDSVLSEDDGEGIKLLCPMDPYGFTCIERERKDGPIPEFPPCFKAKNKKQKKMGGKKGGKKKDEL